MPTLHGSLHCKPSTDYHQLVSRIHAHDVTALEDLYHTFQQGVRWYIGRTIGTTDQEDRLHDVFVDAITGIQRGRLRDPNCLAGFIMGIARHKMCETIRERTKERVRGSGHGECREYGDDLCNIPSQACGPDNALVRRETITLMTAALRKLSDQDCEILTRFYLNEENPEHICAAMELSDTQFRLIKARAKARLIKCVKATSGRAEIASGVRRAYSRMATLCERVSGRTYSVVTLDRSQPSAGRDVAGEA